MPDRQSCEVLGHDVETIRDYEHGQVIRRHGDFRFAYPILFPPENRELIAQYERSIDEWLRIVHHNG